MDIVNQSVAMIGVEVAYATPERQLIIALQVAEGTTAYEAVIQSGITAEFEGIDPQRDPMGIFSRPLDGKSSPLPAEYELQVGDRVEIYRPLIIDPKQARLKRADTGAKNKGKAKQ
jgi:uncharacterized protein